MTYILCDTTNASHRGCQAIVWTPELRTGYKVRAIIDGT